MTPEERQQRGVRAKQIIEDPLFVEASNSIREAVISKLEGHDFKNEEERDYLVVCLQVQRTFVRQFQRMIEDGMLADAETQRPDT